MKLKRLFLFKFYIQSKFVRNRYNIKDFNFINQKGGSFKIKHTKLEFTK